jgi:hypothetical protein
METVEEENPVENLIHVLEKKCGYNQTSSSFVTEFNQVRHDVVKKSSFL